MITVGDLQLRIVEAASTTVDLPAWLAVVGAVLTLAATGGTAWQIARSKSIEATLNTLTIANAELRKANDDLRLERDDDRTKFSAELAAEREKRAELEGRMSLLLDGMAERIVGAVADAWARAHPNTQEAR